MAYLQVGRLRLAQRDADARPRGPLPAPPDPGPPHRRAHGRHARLCAGWPHRWWPLGRYGQLCLRCSLYRRDPTSPDHGQGAGGRHG